MKSIAERIDFLGCFLLLGASVFLVAAVENAGLRHLWKSILVSPMLVISGVLWIMFLLWEWKVARDNGVMEPVFPWRFLQSRLSFGLMLYVSTLPSIVSHNRVSNSQPGPYSYLALQASQQFFLSRKGSKSSTVLLHLLQEYDFFHTQLSPQYHLLSPPQWLENSRFLRCTSSSSVPYARPLDSRSCQLPLPLLRF